MCKQTQARWFLGSGRVQDWSEYSKKTGPLTWRETVRQGDASGGMATGSGVLTCSRGQDRTSLDAEKKSNLTREGSGPVRTQNNNKKVSEGHSLTQGGLPRP